MPSAEELKLLQALPLEIKIAKTKLRIREWVNYFGAENCYVSFSGGKDSTVLLDLVRQEYPQIEGVFIDTGLEYPEIRNHVKTYDNIVWLKPEMNFRKVILTYGYPIVSKEISHKIYWKNKGSKWAEKYFVLNSDNRYSVASKWWFLLDNQEIKVSDICCSVMKKKPAHKYEKETGKVSFIGTTTEESLLREQAWVKSGCNAFEGKYPRSAPLSFWKEQDILQYIYEKQLPIASVYGDVVRGMNGFTTTGVERTGCIFCGYGVHLESEPNRYQMLYRTHPKLWDYCMRPIEEGGLGFQKVMDTIGVNTVPEYNLFDYVEDIKKELEDESTHES